MEATDDSPARGFKGMLSRKGRVKDDSSMDRADSRSTSESAPEKFKPRPSVSEGGADHGDGKKSTLLSGRKKSKSKLARKGQQDAGSDTVLPMTGTTSATSLGVGDGGSANGSTNGEGRSSTMTSDSELEHNRYVRSSCLGFKQPRALLILRLCAVVSCVHYYRKQAVANDHMTVYRNLFPHLHRPTSSSAQACKSMDWAAYQEARPCLSIPQTLAIPTDPAASPQAQRSRGRFDQARRKRRVPTIHPSLCRGFLVL